MQIEGELCNKTVSREVKEGYNMGKWTELWMSLDWDEDQYNLPHAHKIDFIYIEVIMSGII